MVLDLRFTTGFYGLKGKNFLEKNSEALKIWDY